MTLKERHHVTSNSKDRDGKFKMHTSQGIIKFIPHESSLHYLDLKDKEEEGTILVKPLEKFLRDT